MPLTENQRNDLMAVLSRTGGHREVNLKTRVIPDGYRAYEDRCLRQEHMLLFPGLAPLRVVVTRPKDDRPGKALHVNYHGGGFVFRQDHDDDLYCAHIAAEAGSVVVDVDYAVSTEASYPMAADQSWEAAQWAFAHSEEWGCDRGRFSVGGSSAGGNLALTVALRNHGRLPICLMVLEYAATDLYQSIVDPAQERSAAFSRLYADGDDDKLKDPMLSPCFASDAQLRALPETLIIAPGKCPFYKTNQELGRRIEQQGVRVTVREYPDAAHGFIVRMVGDEWLEAQDQVIAAIRAASASR